MTDEDEEFARKEHERATSGLDPENLVMGDLGREPMIKFSNISDDDPKKLKFNQNCKTGIAVICSQPYPTE